MLVNGNALHIPLADKSVQCVVTSPPYYGLRDYGTATWEGGDSDCNHKSAKRTSRYDYPMQEGSRHKEISETTKGTDGARWESVCPDCGAVKKDAQIGLEETAGEYVANMVQVFREVWRVLRDDGTAWLNLGSSYASGDSYANQTRPGRRVSACGIDDKERLNSLVIDYAYRHLCDEHLGDFLSHHRHTMNNVRQQEQPGELPLKIIHDIERLDCASAFLGALPLCAQASTNLLSFLRLRGECFRCDSRASAPSEFYSCDCDDLSCVHSLDGLAKTPYCNQGNVSHGAQPNRHSQYKDTVCEYCKFSSCTPSNVQPHYTTYKAKDLVPIPWLVALALQKDGWYLRNDIIWSKPNPMPESVKDRCTKSHEYIFLLTKKPRYFYDNDAIKEPHSPESFPRALRGLSKENKWNKGAPGSTAHTMSKPRKNVRKEWEEKHGGGGSGFDGHSGYCDENGRLLIDPKGRNKRTVWTVSTKPYHGAHYATFPPDLIDDCIKAGTSEKGKCPECGAPWERVKEVLSAPDRDEQEIRSNMVGVIPGRDKECRMNSVDMASIVYEEVGWEPTCEHDHEPIPCLVMDPFVGSGTTCLVSRDLGRHSVGLDLSLEYLIDNARKRLQHDKLEYWINGEAKLAPGEKYQELPLFEGM